MEIKFTRSDIKTYYCLLLELEKLEELSFISSELVFKREQGAYRKGFNYKVSFHNNSNMKPKIFKKHLENAIEEYKEYLRTEVNLED